MVGGLSQLRDRQYCGHKVRHGGELTQFEDV
jgi:hypothetical protein